ncbi:ABC transporter permease [Beijerinckia indica]|uniref:Binding-protein-dependent transport systems inner membrane component n=1 Tax=Beijerinckia indica subsp. indica (strain ATCC 9039 / DSM 1715 / NCIMB 8712) TaxID=395963 RepID=B2IIT9_BEII9|nr:ABC transporter permease [Beijerinckia indica]ACB96151.1 binding-protein-dependent transport systems inner membrane component [Beijerinckia indica subsp. indica ATCC 9039]
MTHSDFILPVPKAATGQAKTQALSSATSKESLSSPTEETSPWPNVHAPDAARAITRDVIRPAQTDRWRAPRLRRFFTHPTAVAGVLILTVVTLAALLAPVLFPESPLSMVGRPLSWPGQNPRFPLGTDSMGHDIFSGLVHGARISLLVGSSAALIGLSVGIVSGALAGYFGGFVDAVLSKITEIFQTIPAFLLVIVVVAIAQPTIFSITLAIALVSWPPITRLVRTEFRSLREKEFVMAARGLGFSHTRIILQEILPNALPPVIVMTSVTVATAILMESGLAFMGLGDPNVVSWGSMIGAGRDLLRSAWYLCAVPGLAIVLTVLALNLIGDGLNEALNPRLSRD